MKDLKSRILELEKSRTEAGKKALIPLLLEHLRARPRDTAAWYKLACCYDFLGRERAAEPCYGQVYKDWRALPPAGQPGFFLGYGSTLRNNRKLARSAAVLKEGARRFPAYPALKAFLALTLYSRREFRASARALFKACLDMPAGAFNGYERALAHYVKYL